MEKLGIRAGVVFFVLAVVLYVSGGVDAQVTSVLREDVISDTSVAAVSRGDVSNFGALERGGACQRPRCVSNEEELQRALTALGDTGGGTVTLCRSDSRPIELNERIFAPEFISDVTIECCDIRTRTDRTVPACTIRKLCTTCNIDVFFVDSVTLRGIQFEDRNPNSDGSVTDFGALYYQVDGSADSGSDIRLSISDCVFRDFKGSTFPVGFLPDLRARAITFVLSDVSDGSFGSAEIEIVRSGFFDNDSGGAVVYQQALGNRTDGLVTIDIRESQFENGGVTATGFRPSNSTTENGGFAMVGPLRSMSVSSSRFIANKAPRYGGGLLVVNAQDQLNSGIGIKLGDTVGITLSDNLFDGNEVFNPTRGSGGATFVQGGGAVALLVGQVDEINIEILDSRFFNNIASTVPGPDGVIDSEESAIGGGLYVASGLIRPCPTCPRNPNVEQTLTIDRCRFKNNAAVNGAAAQIDGG